jgi:hypothetical protein
MTSQIVQTWQLLARRPGLYNPRCTAKSFPSSYHHFQFEGDTESRFHLHNGPTPITTMYIPTVERADPIGSQPVDNSQSGEIETRTAVGIGVGLCTFLSCHVQSSTHKMWRRSKLPHTAFLLLPRLQMEKSPSSPTYIRGRTKHEIIRTMEG